MNNLARIVTEVVCRNTVPDFDSRGNPVLTWNAGAGYKAISDTISEIFTEPQEGDVERLENWLDLGCGVYRYRFHKEAAYEICIHHRELDADELQAIADLYLVGIAHSEERKPYFGRFRLMERGLLQKCLEYVKRDLEDTE